jgi:hypothetical protein
MRSILNQYRQFSSIERAPEDTSMPQQFQQKFPMPHSGIAINQIIAELDTNGLKLGLSFYRHVLCFSMASKRFGALERTTALP